MAVRSSSRLLLGCLMVVGAAVAAAPQADRPTAEQMARRAGERLQALQSEADDLAARERTLLDDLRRLEIDREMKAAQLDQITADVSRVQRELDDTTATLAGLQAREATDAPALRARLVELYKLGQGKYLRLLLSATDLRRLGQASRTVATLARLDRERFAAHQQQVAALEATRAELATRAVQLQAVQADADRVRTEAARATAARQALVREIDARRDLNAQLTAELLGAQQKLQVALRELASGAPTATVALPLRPFRGDLPWPLEGTVARRFGRPASARGASSNGVDLAAPEGTVVRAVHEGTVAFADTFAGFGRLVIVDHGAQAFSLYGNLLDLDVTRGSRVTRGQPLGTAGASATGVSGLYFELRVDGQPVDPLQWLRKPQPVSR